MYKVKRVRDLAKEKIIKTQKFIIKTAHLSKSNWVVKILVK